MFPLTDLSILFLTLLIIAIFGIGLLVLLGLHICTKSSGITSNQQLLPTAPPNPSTEPTLAEVRNEIIKQAEKSNISIWLTAATFGGAVAVVGIPFAAQQQYSTALPIFIIGVGFMIWARIMASKRQKAFRAKWNEQPRI